MRLCKKCGKLAMKDRLLCKECYRVSRLRGTEAAPDGMELTILGKTYTVTRDGRVYNNLYRKYLSPIRMKNGYIMYSFGSTSAGNRKQYYAHRLVAAAYGLLKNLDDERHIDHINNRRDDNRLDNLQVVDRSENNLISHLRNKGYLYAIKHGVEYGPFKSVKEMYSVLSVKATLDSFYSQVSRGAGYGYIFERRHRGN